MGKISLTELIEALTRDSITDVRIDANDASILVSPEFKASDAGKEIEIISGDGFTAGVYTIQSVDATAGTVKLDGAAGATGSTGGTVKISGGLSSLIEAPKLVTADGGDSFGQLVLGVELAQGTTLIDLGVDPRVTFTVLSLPLSEHEFTVCSLEDSRNFWISGDQAELIEVGAELTIQGTTDIKVDGVEVCGPATKVTVTKDLPPPHLFDAVRLRRRSFR
jgi:hypothetical protein